MTDASCRVNIDVQSWCHLVWDHHSVYAPAATNRRQQPTESSPRSTAHPSIRQLSRARARELGQTIATLDLDQATAWYLEKVPGWDGQRFEAWRAEGEARWWKELIVAASPAMVEWLGPWLDLGYIRTHRSQWVTFWTREVRRERLPREWIRWATTEVQALKKVTPGTPVDNQIATYLPDFDTFVTADRGFIQCVEARRP